VLFGALLAPAILAAGLLAGQMRGFEDVGASVGVTAGGGGGKGLAFEPVLVPAPVRPDRVYEGAVSAPVRVLAKPSPAVKSGDGVGDEPAPVVEDPYTPAPVRPRAGCPGEWVDTWLWELCREEEQAERVRGVADSWLPGI
jgi:hypothetical protein